MKNPKLATDARNNNFDLVRLVAAFCVVYGHAFILVGKSPPGFAANSVSTLGVKVFFAISGYLVATSWINDPHLGRFFLKRALRIFPGLIVVTILSIVLLGPLVSRLPLSDYFSHPMTHFYLNNIRLYISFNLPGVFEGNIYPNAVNGNLWSLPVEFAMYIVTPAAILFASSGFIGRPLDASRTFILFAIVFCMVAFYFAIYTTPPVRVVIYASDLTAALQVAPYFVVGMTVAVSRLERFLSLQVALLLMIMFAAIGMSATVMEAALIILLPYVVLSFAVSHSSCSNFLRGRDISYGLFLYSFPVQQLVIWGGVSDPWVLLVLSLLICLPLAYASWIIVEKRALQYKPTPGQAAFTFADFK